MAAAPLAQSEHFALHGIAWPWPPEAETLPRGPGPWLGLVVSRRGARRAVTRNLIKRQARAVAALHPPPPGAWVLRLKRGWPTSEFPSAASRALRRAVRAELMWLLRDRLPQRLAGLKETDR
ncbi:Ribonuclease P protein component [Tepidimonas alkaliphilus]|uniref:Ribonuclease P protein component n=1 Tax=Tepidimonas alkaliphilus TaxID=2588942 RepID=A0A554WBM4_9BURK|nr:Ribonuclease P protein component [Tepidimonas alkaliphilus]